jgi:hypothetical protein
MHSHGGPNNRYGAGGKQVCDEMASRSYSLESVDTATDAALAAPFSINRLFFLYIGRKKGLLCVLMN